MRSIEQGPIVSKFGGSSSATAELIKRNVGIIHEDPARLYVVFSAPGKRHSQDVKVTDLLLTSNDRVENRQSFDDIFDVISGRYEEIARELGVHSPVVGWLTDVYSGIQNGMDRDWVASRGEWLLAKTVAQFTGDVFVDASDLIRLHDNGFIDPLTYSLIGAQFSGNTRVQIIPGFYGADNKGAIRIFPRGGSDITGAIIAKGVGASIYENWTDVDGVKSADPRVVSCPATIPQLTYREMRELGNGGADVLQRDTILPVYEAGIPIHVRNASRPDHPGTVISRQREVLPTESVLGIAGKTGYVSIQVERFGMNEEIGIVSSVLEIIKSYGIPYEHGPTGIDSMSVIINQDHLGEKETDILNAIHARVQPDSTSVMRNIGLICLVGEGIAQKTAEVLDVLSWTLRELKIDIHLVTYRAGGNSLVFGVANEDLSRAINGLYNTFIR